MGIIELIYRHKEMFNADVRILEFISLFFCKVEHFYGFRRKIKLLAACRGADFGKIVNHRHNSVLKSGFVHAQSVCVVLSDSVFLLHHRQNNMHRLHLGILELGHKFLRFCHNILGIIRQSVKINHLKPHFVSLYFHFKEFFSKIRKIND